MSVMRVSLSNRVEEFPRVSAAVLDFLDEEGAPPDVVYRVRLVVEELVVNVIRHGYNGDQADHRIQLELRSEPRQIVITVEDDGKPFDPHDAPAPPLHEPIETRPRGGLGLYLVREMSKNLTYARVDGRNRVCVIVEHGQPKESQ